MLEDSIGAFPCSFILSSNIIVSLLLITKQIIHNTTILNLSIGAISKQINILAKSLNIGIITSHDNSSMIIILINLNESFNTVFPILA